MFNFLRPLLFSLILLPAVVLAAPPAPAPAKTPPKPVAPALPTTVDIATFVVRDEAGSHKLIVTTSPTLMRVDLPGEAYSIIYNQDGERYTGLEHSNYTYWEYSWPEIRAAVETSKRYASHLQELNLAGINADLPPATTNAPGTDAPSASIPDTSGYVWKQTNDKRKIAGLDCSKWTGETVSGDSVEAWCFNGPLPKVQAAIDRLQVINEPMSLVALRTVVPPFVFPVFRALTKGSVTPLQINWGTNREKNSFAFVEGVTKEAKPTLFIVPKLYMKTTLVSMDGLIDQKK